MNESEALKLIAKLELAFRPMPPEEQNLYVRYLSRLPFAAADRAVEELIETEQFLPRVGTVREAAARYLPYDFGVQGGRPAGQRELVPAEAVSMPDDVRERVASMRMMKDPEQDARYLALLMTEKRQSNRRPPPVSSCTGALIDYRKDGAFCSHCGAEVEGDFGVAGKGG